MVQLKITQDGFNSCQAISSGKVHPTGVLSVIAGSFVCGCERAFVVLES